MNRLIIRIIALPLALHIFKQDREQLDGLYVGNVYLDKIDSIIEDIHRDINESRAQLLKQYGLTLRKISATEYRWNDRKDSGTLTYTSEQLKAMTSDIMREYLFSAEPFERKERVWDRSMLPPDAELD
ncbi:hypothetical protein SAMN05216389_11150 [Oceanobacillus limi]|uniref:Uncharacterized protein n=1 Tax=Oceanobacillus limi TaxID=930131 RepID=A0A1I0EDP5_9BACI|nr:hypothetical protein [Oceanobacillus limi]SET43094.1 hypothetical protein SAMN05216389_11150 [Oceanobacillus limi]